MSARSARPPATPLDLTPAQVRIAQQVAEGKSTDAIASDLTITAGTINVQMKHCGQKLGVRGRAAVVHACYVTGQLERPKNAAFPGSFSEVETETWQMIAAGATSEVYANRARISRDEARQRMRALRQRVQAHNDPHLVTLGWTYEVLDESLVEMVSGTVLRAPARV
ncbi:helix-turn-helix transcriptional regulator [Streptomyces phyllanthi]|uniref:Helix-turn-helix transcriptional regulator n=1 Tax=Streptomyces phyllanthi TaxID=1803180 RepID=A0A5N8VUW2_9ACTN|nr:helix-turn-helix transcriptional regulator [Streptomyces phyllanthi]MPY38562.1 helix-turn-helix transcriptional regulator [Streptomyces phyllanthi]